MDRKYQDIYIVDDSWFLQKFPSQRNAVAVSRETINPRVTIRNGIITIEFESYDGEHIRCTFPCEKGQHLIID